MVGVAGDSLHWFYDKLARQVALRLGVPAAEMKSVPIVGQTVDAQWALGFVVVVNVGCLCIADRSRRRHALGAVRELLLHLCDARGLRFRLSVALSAFGGRRSSCSPVGTVRTCSAWVQP